jgi:hypothetical protein
MFFPSDPLVGPWPGIWSDFVGLSDPMRSDRIHSPGAYKQVDCEYLFSFIDKELSLGIFTKSNAILIKKRYMKLFLSCQLLQQRRNTKSSFNLLFHRILVFFQLGITKISSFISIPVYYSNRILLELQNPDGKISLILIELIYNV